MNLIIVQILPKNKRQFPDQFNKKKLDPAKRNIGKNTRVQSHSFICSKSKNWRKLFNWSWCCFYY